MDNRTKNKLYKMSLCLEITEEDALNFCVSQVWDQIFGHAIHCLKSEAVKKTRSIDEALCSPPETVTEKEKQAISNLIANFEQVQKEQDRESWMPKTEEDLDCLEGLEG